jgi:hypothetical protein
MTSSSSTFIQTLDAYLQTSLPKGSSCTLTQLKRILYSLESTHPVWQSFQADNPEFPYLKRPLIKWSNSEWNSLLSSMSQLTGFHQQTLYKRRVGQGSNVRFIYVKQNRIRIL